MNLHVRDADVDVFDFGCKLGPYGDSLVREFIGDLGGEVVDGGAESRIVVVCGLPESFVPEVCEFDLQQHLAAMS